MPQSAQVPPFVGSQSGLTRQQLRGQRYERLSRDLYRLRDEGAELGALVLAMQRLLPDAVACWHTAAQLLSLPVPWDAELHLLRSSASPSKRSGVRTHRMSLDADEVTWVAGVGVTSPTRTFVDLGARLALPDLVALGDAVLRRSGDPALLAAVSRRDRRPGLVQVRRALPLLDAGSDSPAETRMRLRLHAAGFTGMRHGVVVRDAGGGWLARPDLADERARVAVQHDGIVHLRGSVEQRRQDLLRDDLTRAAGWEVVVSTALDDRRPHLLLERIGAAYLRSARLHGPGILPAHLR